MSPRRSSHVRGVWRLALCSLACLGLGLIMPACSFSSHGDAAGGAGAGTGAGGNSNPGTGGNAVSIPGLTALRIEPDAADIMTSPALRGSQVFHAIGTVDGQDKDVTASVRWSTTAPEVATVDAAGLATAAMDRGGTAFIAAGAGSQAAQAKLHVRFTETILTSAGTPALPAQPELPFAGTPAADRKPVLIYPSDGVLLPPNLATLEVHFLRAKADDTLFALSFSNADTDVTLYTRCTVLEEGCMVTLSGAQWTHLAETNRGGQPVSLTVKSANEAAGTFGVSAEQTLSFAQDSLQGALYYWTTSNGTSILRWNFGDPKQTTPESVVDTTQTKDVCVGCHAISHDGKKMFLSTGGPKEGDVLLYDLVARRPLVPFPAPEKLRFGSWNPDGSQYVAAFVEEIMPDLMLIDGNTGALTGSIALGGKKATHPDWSPDGQVIVFTDIGEWTGSDARPRQSGLSYVERVAGNWSSPQRLVAPKAGFNHYYPAVSPDNTFVVYDRSTCPAGKVSDETCDAYEDMSSRLWAAPLPPATWAPVELARANAPGPTDSGPDIERSFPKWSPFVFARSETSKVMWLTFSSARRYGLHKVLTVTGGDSDFGTQVWMVAVDPAALTTGQDPSTPAFCLPFQDIATSNHTAQWTSSVPPAPF